MDYLKVIAQASGKMPLQFTVFRVKTNAYTHGDTLDLGKVVSSYTSFLNNRSGSPNKKCFDEKKDEDIAFCLFFLSNAQ